MARRVLVIGGSGEIGSAIADRLEAGGDEVLRSSRRLADDAPAGAIAVDPFGPAGMDALDGAGPLHAVVWAQGTNANDSVAELDLAVYEDVMRANVTFVAVTMSRLLAAGAVADGARLVVVSSIWQQLTRQRKFSYTVSKAALEGLVHSAAVDLGERGMLVNAVLPSVTDTSMTRSMLSPEQLEAFASQTRFGRLTSLDDVASMVCYLCSDANSGVTGQSIAVDLGYTVGRIL